MKATGNQTSQGTNNTNFGDREPRAKLNRTQQWIKSWAKELRFLTSSITTHWAINRIINVKLLEKSQHDNMTQRTYIHSITYTRTPLQHLHKILTMVLECQRKQIVSATSFGNILHYAIPDIPYYFGGRSTSTIFVLP